MNSDELDDLELRELGVVKKNRGYAMHPDEGGWIIGLLTISIGIFALIGVAVTILFIAGRIVWVS